MEDSNVLTRTEDRPNAGPPVHTWEDNNHAVQEILMRLRKDIASAKGAVRMDDLHTAISLLRESLEDVTYGEDTLPVVKYHLVNALLTRYGLGSGLEDLEECFRHSEGIESVFASTDNSGRIGELEMVAQLIQECRDSVDTGILNAVIDSAQKDISSWLSDSPTLHKSEVLMELGNALVIKYFNHGGIKELDQAAEKLQEAVRMCCGHFPHVNTFLTSQAYVEILRFMECSKIEGSFRHGGHTTIDRGSGDHPFKVDAPMREDSVEEQLQSTIAFLCTSSHHCVVPHPNHLSPSYHLAHALFIRSMLKGDLGDLERCILLNRECLNLRPMHHPSRAFSLYNLSEVLFHRSQRLGNLEDLEEGILLLRESVQLQQNNPLAPHPTFLDHLTAPASDTGRCHPQMNNESTVNASTRGQRTMSTTYPPYHPEYSSLLNSLAVALGARFIKKGNFQDLEESILYFRKGLDLPPTPHSDRPLSQNHLANALLTRFKQKRVMQDIEDSITILREALDLQPTPHPGRSASLSNLADCLLNRFWHSRVLQDLEDCIALSREALDLQPRPHPGRCMSLGNLGNALLAKFRQSGVFQDLEESIATFQEALDLQPIPHQGRSITLNNLANALNTRFKQTHAYQDLENSITLFREALDLQPIHHPERASSLGNLAHSLFVRFEKKGVFQDLQECITILRETLDLQPPRHPGRDVLLNNLGNALFARFKHEQNIQDLEESVTLHRKALVLRPESHPERYLSLINLGDTLLTLFGKKGVLQDIQECIALLRETMNLPTTHPGRAALLNRLAGALRIRYKQTGSVQDLQESITLYQEVHCLPPTAQLDRPSSLNTLADNLLTRFQRENVIEDLDESIALYREVLDLRPTPHSDRSLSLNNLASALLTRFMQKGNLQDLEECVTHHREALLLRPIPHSERFSSLNNLAGALSTRYRQKGTFQDLKESIKLHREALGLPPTIHSDRSLSLNNLAGSLLTSFEHNGAIEELEECIVLQREALDMRPIPHSSRSISLDNLGTALLVRFNQKGDSQDLEESINLQREALDLRPIHHPDRSNSLSNLASALMSRFVQKGTSKDLEECVVLHREALTLRPIPHPTRSISLNNLADTLLTRFEQKGDFRDLEECIVLHREALNLRPRPHSRRHASLNNLADSLCARFQHKGTSQDLEECINLHREALDLLPLPNPSRPLSLAKLAGALGTRFGQKGDYEDLEESIALHREALELRPVPHPDRCLSLDNLASILLTRFNQNGAPQDLEECILLQREALELLPMSHQARASSLNTLARSLTRRFLQKGTLQDLDKSIAILQQVLDQRPPPHPGRWLILHNLASNLLTRFAHKTTSQALVKSGPLHRLTSLFRRRFSFQRDNADVENALCYIEEASKYETASLIARLRSLKLWSDFARKFRPASALRAFHYLMELLPQLVSLDLTLQQRLDVLEHSGELVASAAKCAIDENQFKTAVMFLSTGRIIFWSQTLQLRSTEMDRLRLTHPALAEALVTPSNRLESSSYSDQSLKSYTYTGLYDLATRRLQTIQEIRRIRGLEGFLLPPSFASLKSAGDGGPFVFLNASNFGCDALVMHGNGRVEHVPLPDIRSKELGELNMLVSMLLETGIRSIDLPQGTIDVFQRLLGRDMVHGNSTESNQDTFRMVLECIWVKVVQPVLETVGIKKTNSPGRIWWCPIGLFTFLPIHAAGIYSEDNDPIDCIFQYTVSSYCNSPQDLLHPSPAVAQDFKMTVVIEPEAPNAQGLPATREELKKIEQHVSDRQHLLIHAGSGDDPGQLDNLLSNIQRSSFVHFGCHGMQNLQNPLESYLLLSGGKLTMSMIIKECRVFEGALAHLSACETAKGDDARPDESLNLVATMMFAGFRSVVGTMWSIMDQDAPIVADVFYSHLFRRGTEAPPDVRDAALGLHLATEELRRQGAPFYRWIPYVHYGI